jgi:hypothetical protein
MSRGDKVTIVVDAGAATTATCAEGNHWLCPTPAECDCECHDGEPFRAGWDESD